MSGEADLPPPPDDEPVRPADPAAGVSTLTMLDALRSNPDDPGKALLGALAGQGGGPQSDMLMRLLMDQGGSQQDALREQIREEVRAEQAEAIAALEDTARRLFAERDAALARLDSLAAALGACPACLGEDLLCDTCHGAGTPGGRAPEPQAFHRLVVPALDRVRAAMRGSAARRPWPRPAEPSPTTALDRDAPPFNAATLNGGLQS